MVLVVVMMMMMKDINKFYTVELFLWINDSCFYNHAPLWFYIWTKIFEKKKLFQLCSRISLGWTERLVSSLEVLRFINWFGLVIYIYIYIYCRNFVKELVILFHRTAAAPWGHVASIIKKSPTRDSSSISTPTAVSRRSIS